VTTDQGKVVGMELETVRGQALLGAEPESRLDLGACVEHAALAVELADPAMDGFDRAQEPVDARGQDGQAQVGPRRRHVLADGLLQPTEELIAGAGSLAPREAPAECKAV
jgi:hypothetical protein